MSVMQGTVVQKYINIQSSDGTPIDITGWTLRASLRRSPTDPAVLSELTTANAGLVLVDPPNGRLAFVLDDAVTTILPVGRIHFDVLHVNGPAGPVWLFGGNFLVKQPITR
jgi:hypothetical protein